MRTLEAAALAAALAALAAPALAGRRADRFDALILRHSERHRLDPRLVKALIQAESDFQPRAVSPAGARGLMQLMPATALELGVPKERLFEPDANIRAGTAYLGYLFRTLWKRHRLPGTCCREAPGWAVRTALAGYHAGPRAMRRPDTAWHHTTRHYVGKVAVNYRMAGSRLRRGQPPDRPRPPDTLVAGEAPARERRDWGAAARVPRAAPAAALKPRRRRPGRPRAQV